MAARFARRPPILAWAHLSKGPEHTIRTARHSVPTMGTTDKAYSKLHLTWRARVPSRREETELPACGTRRPIRVSAICADIPIGWFTARFRRTENGLPHRATTARCGFGIFTTFKRLRG